MAVIEIEGRRVEVDDSFLSLSPEQQAAAVEEIAAGMGIKPERSGMMQQINAGLAEGLGAPVDLVTAGLNALGANIQSPVGGSDSIKRAMGLVGVNPATAQPQGVGEAFLRGAGQAVGGAPIAGGIASALRGAGGITGQIADDAARALNSRAGVVTEGIAGGIAGSAAQMAQDAGAPVAVQQIAAIAAPMSIPAAAAIATRTPGMQVARRAAGMAAGAVAPFTGQGAREVARQRVQSLAGGRERAEQLADMIGGSEIPLSPARQTGDPNMIGLEEMAAAQDPNLRERLSASESAARGMAQDQISVEGSPEGAQAFISDRQRQFRRALTDKANAALEAAQRRIRDIGPQNPESDNSTIVMEEIDRAYKAARQTESELYARVPKEATVEVYAARDKASEWQAELGTVNADNMPPKARQYLLDENKTITDQATVRELYNLYSDMRATARNARAGNKTNPTMAKIADEIADSILEDLGAVDGQTAVGRTINEARAFSAEMHEVFDQGAVGRLRKKTLDGDTATNPELALERTIGRQGQTAAVASQELRRAGGENTPMAIEDYIRDRFSMAIENASGEFTPKTAANFIRNNKALLDQYPELRAELTGAAGQGLRAEQIEARIAEVIQRSGQEKFSALARFTGGSPEKAIQSIFSAQNPIQAARVLRNAASKDESGKALAGLKAAFTDEVIRKSITTGAGSTGLDADKLSAYITNPRNAAMLRTVLSDAEFSRLDLIAKELVKLDARGANVGTSLSQGEPNKLVEFAVRIFAARQGAQYGGGGGASIQTAAMASDRAKAALNSLFRDKASQIIADAITDPELFKALLTDVGKIDLEKTMPRFLPYMVGGAGVAAQQGAE